MITLGRTIPSLPVRDMAAAVTFYTTKVGFAARHQDDGFAVLHRDDAVVHLWQSADESWRERDLADKPVRSGAESFLAGTASCRIEVTGIDELFAELRDADVLHPVSQRDGISSTDFGSREFHALDADGNLLSFFVWVT